MNLRVRRALRAANILDDLVDDQLPLIAALSENSRRRVAEHLAEVVTLADAYRAYADGMISRTELASRAENALITIDSVRTRPLADPSTGPGIGSTC